MNKSSLHLLLSGLGMGIAEVIPGVSGGTIAFISGVYHKLLESIRSFDGQLMRLLMGGHFNQAADRINLKFLVWLLSGMAAGLLIGIIFITHLLKTNPEMLWSGFFALILGSMPFMFRSLKSFKLGYLIFFLLAAAFAFVITGLTPAGEAGGYVYLFFGGMLAIVALVLPGISGSFILLLLGLYTLVIPTLKSMLSQPSMEAFYVVLVFAAGCLTGLLLFARIVSAAFKRFHDHTIVVMSGFMLGSLNKIWPWRNPDLVLNKQSGRIMAFEDIIDWDAESYKILTEQNVFPDLYFSQPHTSSVIIVFALVLLLMLWLNRRLPPL